MEFLIKTDLNAIPQAIDFNFEEMKAELTEKLTAYNALVVTEDSIRDAKADKAKLNKLRTAVEDKRKEVKKLCLAPYENFEKQCKEIVALIDEPIKSIDGQVAVFDQKLQDEKWEQITEYYQSEVKELLELVPLERIVSPKWKNKTESLESVCNGIGDRLDAIRTDLQTIEGLGSEFQNEVTNTYLTDFNLSKAIAYKNHLEEHKRQMEEMKARKIAESAEKPAVVPTPQPEPVKVEATPEPAPVPAPAPQKPDPMYKVKFETVGTKAQIIALREYMNANGIKYEVIK